jgi:uncharacterized membrane protein YqhA
MRAIGRILERLDLLASAAVVVLSVLGVVTLGWAAAKGGQFVQDLVTNEGWREAAAIAGLLDAVDTLLVGITLLIVAAGLYELFVGDLDLPDWLVTRDLGELKSRISDAVVIILTVKFTERFLTAGTSGDVFRYGLAVAAVIAVLVLFNVFRSQTHWPGATPGPDPPSAATTSPPQDNTAPVDDLAPRHEDRRTGSQRHG